MNELSIFVDESGDFGEHEPHNPYYIICLVLHDQKNDISEDVKRLEENLGNLGYPNHCFHTGPLIRGEKEYRDEDIKIRQKILKNMIAFIRHVEISFHTVYIEKRKAEDEIMATSMLSKQISRFIKDNLPLFLKYDIVKIYYDNGQVQITRILASVFNTLLDNVEFKKASPSDYRLFQAADTGCTMRLLALKLESHTLSRSELFFFEDERCLKKNYLKRIEEATV